MVVMVIMPLSPPNRIAVFGKPHQVMLNVHSIGAQAGVSLRNPKHLGGIISLTLSREAGMAGKRKPDPKAAALAETRTLNPRPEAVRDEQFVSSEFFDARDLVQVKYEMVRRVRVDGAPSRI